MKNKDNETLEKIAMVLVKVDNGLLSDKKAIDKIMNITLKNSNRKLKEYLDKQLNKKGGR